MGKRQSVPPWVRGNRMELNDLIEIGADFFRDHTLWAVLVVLGIGALICWKPKDMFKIALAGLALGAIIYVLGFLVDLTSRGIDQSRKFTNTPEVKVE